VNIIGVNNIIKNVGVIMDGSNHISSLISEIDGDIFTALPSRSPLRGGGEAELIYSYEEKQTTMRYELGKGAHSVYALQYHLVQVVKQRKKVLENGVIDLLKQKIREISGTFEAEVLNLECDKDHFHLIFKAKPTLDMPRYINAVKPITSREIQRNFPKVKRKLWKGVLWSPSYFLATTGQVTLDVLKKYVEEQGNA